MLLYETWEDWTLEDGRFGALGPVLFMSGFAPIILASMVLLTLPSVAWLVWKEVLQ